jgi:hypothetical protein
MREHRVQPGTDRSFIERFRIEQRFTRLLDRVSHAERRRLATRARGEIRLAVSRIERMCVRVDKTRKNDVILKV